MREPAELRNFWQEKMPLIPYLPFPEHWLVQILPPYAGALIRFRVKLQENGLPISVYLDADNSLGAGGPAYWELYPNLNRDCTRFDLAETDGLIAELERILSANAPSPFPLTTDTL